VLGACSSRALRRGDGRRHVRRTTSECATRRGLLRPVSRRPARIETMTDEPRIYDLTRFRPRSSDPCRTLAELCRVARLGDSGLCCSPGGDLTPGLFFFLGPIAVGAVSPRLVLARRSAFCGCSSSSSSAPPVRSLLFLRPSRAGPPIEHAARCSARATSGAYGRPCRSCCSSGARPTAGRVKIGARSGRPRHTCPTQVSSRERRSDGRRDRAPTALFYE